MGEEEGKEKVLACSLYFPSSPEGEVHWVHCFEGLFPSCRGNLREGLWDVFSRIFVSFLGVLSQGCGLH